MAIKVKLSQEDRAAVIEQIVSNSNVWGMKDVLTLNKLSSKKLMGVLEETAIASGVVEAEEEVVQQTNNQEAVSLWKKLGQRLGLITNKGKTKSSCDCGGTCPKCRKSNSKGAKDMATKLTKEQRGTIVNALVANCDCGDATKATSKGPWTANDKPMLEAMTDEKLVELDKHRKTQNQAEVVANAARQGFNDQQGNNHVFNEKTGKWEQKEKETTTNSAGDPPAKPKTSEEWLKEAPPDVQSVVRNAMASEKKHKDNLIARITANANNTFTKDWLAAQSIETLAGIAKMSGEQTTNGGSSPAPLFVGSGDGDPTTNDDEKDEVLQLPTINYNEDKEDKKTKTA